MVLVEETQQIEGEGVLLTQRVVLELSLLVMLVLKKVQVAQLQPLVEIPFTPSLHPAHTPHKEQTWHLHK
jgi:hypothetical protein